jgi:hypothetical protein
VPYNAHRTFVIWCTRCMLRVKGRLALLRAVRSSQWLQMVAKLLLRRFGGIAVAL